MTNDEFDRLFKDMSDRFDKIEGRLDGMATKGDLDGLRIQLDGLLDRMDTDSTERAAMVHQQDRQQGKLDDHEDRIAGLEQQLAA
ncbi:hypothetical protein ACWZJV_05485 [Nocardioides sp. WG-D5]